MTTQIVRQAGLLVDDDAIETAAVVQVAGAQEDPAIRTSTLLFQHHAKRTGTVRENARSPADLHLSWFGDRSSETVPNEAFCAVPA